MANDIFEEGYAGERLITSVSYGSEGGPIQIAQGQRALVYSPPADYAGTEQFVYFVDGQLSATVTVSVTAPLAHDAFTLFPDGQAHRA